MKRLAPLLFLLAACSSTGGPDLPQAVRQVRINMPAESLAVEGANPRRWNAPVSFGPWRTTIVNEGTTRSWLADAGVLDLASTDQAYRFALAGETGTTNVDCHTRELVAGRAGVFVQASLGTSPILVCGLERNGLHSVLAVMRSGSVDPSLRGELRQVGGTTYDVRSVNRAAGASIPSSEPFGYEILRDESALAIVETVNRGRVWVDPDAPNREDLAATAAALLLFLDPDAGAVGSSQ